MSDGPLERLRGARSRISSTPPNGSGGFWESSGATCALGARPGNGVCALEPLTNGFLSGKYRPGMEVTDSARTASVGGPNEEEFAVIEAVAAIADELGTTSAAVALAWLRARAETVVPMP
jgi:aryl-alcohol dehydrogenase-like predicted oxidoreductase